MAFDINERALPALWATDPGFVELAKQLYGDNVTLESVQKDLFGKMDPTPSDVHVPGGAPVGRKKKPMTIKPQTNEESVEVGLAKNFYELVEKAFEAGLIDSEGNLNESEIQKSVTYVRDHGGRFARSGGAVTGHLVAAGVLAGTGAVLAAKSPKAVETAGKDLSYVSAHLHHPDPVTRHVARALLPHAMKSTGKAVATAGVGAASSAGAVYEGTKTYEGVRHMAINKRKKKPLNFKRDVTYGESSGETDRLVEGVGGDEPTEKDVKKNALEVVWTGDISKVDSDRQQVFGWASVAELDGKPVVDLQGDYIHPEDVEKAAYDYVLNSRVGGDMHDRVDSDGNVIEKSGPRHVSDLIESVVFTPEKCEAMGISKSVAGRWWTGFQVNDPDVWADVKSGARTGFSIHGAGLRKAIEETDPISDLIGKAYEVSKTDSELIDNLATLYDVTGEDEFAELAKHLAHGINTPQAPSMGAHNGAAWGAGIGGSAGANVGHIAGAFGGEKSEKLGGAVGGLAGAAIGAGIGAAKDHKVATGRPMRPPSVQAVLGPDTAVTKAVSTTNRMGGSPSSRQEMYTQQALQQATEQLAPQVAQHIQNMQQQQWQQQMMEQQQMAALAQQMPESFAVQVGPYANHQNGNSDQGKQHLSQQNAGNGASTQPAQMPSPNTPSFSMPTMA